MSKLQSVLNDEESMKQIKDLAGMLGNELTESPQSNSQPAVQPTSSPQNSTPDFSQLLANLGGASGEQNNPQPQTLQPADNPIDIQKIMQLTSIISQANKSDKNVELLLALKPLLKEENQAKIDRLIKIFKLFAIYPLLKESGLLGGDLFGLL